MSCVWRTNEEGCRASVLQRPPISNATTTRRARLPPLGGPFLWRAVPDGLRLQLFVVGGDGVEFVL